MNGSRLIWIGLGGVLLGIALPLLMVLDVIRTTLLLSFLAFSLSVAGLFLGLIGSVMVVRSSRNRER